MRADGGISDAQMVGDTEAAVKWIRAQSDHNGKVGIFGSCSGGRHAFIYACQRKDVDACVELWGGRVVMNKEDLNAKTPVAPVEMTKDLSCPLLGGNAALTWDIRPSGIKGGAMRLPLLHANP